jgi:hypothetical protein
MAGRAMRSLRFRLRSGARREASITRHLGAGFLSDDHQLEPCRRPEREKPVMSRLAIAFVLALAANAANAQQSQTPAAAGNNGTKPFLFDARMPGDGVRRGVRSDNHHPGAGAIIVSPKASQPGRER